MLALYRVAVSLGAGPAAADLMGQYPALFKPVDRLWLDYYQAVNLLRISAQTVPFLMRDYVKPLIGETHAALVGKIESHGVSSRVIAEITNGKFAAGTASSAMSELACCWNLGALVATRNIRLSSTASWVALLQRPSVAMKTRSVQKETGKL